MKGKLSLWTLSVLFLTGCVETIVMDPHEDMPVVVYCVLTNKSDVQTLDLSAAESPSGEKPEVVAREVTVTASSEEKHVFATSDGARWTAHFRPEPLILWTLGNSPCRTA